jgi:hypothetical protein
VATIGVFEAITRRVITENGFDGFLPTVLYPLRKQLAALDGAPESPDLERIVLAWAAKGAVGDEEFLVAFKIGPNEFKIIRRSREGMEYEAFNVAGDA